MPLPDAPDEFYEKLGRVQPGDSDGFLAFLLESHERGWIEILGVTDQDPRDIAAAAQGKIRVMVMDNTPKENTDADSVD